MAESYIRFDGVWKRFRRGAVHDSLRDLIPALTKRLLLGRSRNGDLKQGEFWALRDVSFEVRPGDALGIIGGNGAGKSTALKILTRILRANRGRAEVQGRIGALIEVAAGFHGDLSGRENVFLQGSIMGMPQEMIRRKFDEIVEFSGIAEFIDTPVKRYSSGMNARLGFAIAVHLDPDVLIIDEVLAVGDFRFQERAFGRIHELAKSGIPVVIVSHQLERIATLCTTAILLDHGQVAARGTPADCIAAYLAGTRSVDPLASHASAIRLKGLKPVGPSEVCSGEPAVIELSGEVIGALVPEEEICLRVRSTATTQVVAGVDTHRLGLVLPGGGPFRARVELDMNTRPGVYVLESYVRELGSERVIYAGPIAYVQVHPEPGFVGTVHLRPRLTMMPAPTGEDVNPGAARGA